MTNIKITTVRKNTPTSPSKKKNPNMQPHVLIPRTGLQQHCCDNSIVNQYWVQFITLAQILQILQIFPNQGCHYSWEVWPTPCIWGCDCDHACAESICMITVISSNTYKPEDEGLFLMHVHTWAQTPRWFLQRESTIWNTGFLSTTILVFPSQVLFLPI